MADNRSIVITLKLDNGSEDSNDISEQTNTNTSKGDKDSTAKAVAKFAVAQSMQVVASEVINWAEYYWDRKLTLTDDYVGQRNKQIALTQINRGIGTFTSIGSMTAAGAAVGHGIGAAIGFLIGTATQIASITRSNLQGRDQQNILLRQIEAQLDFTRSRAGWSTQAASIGEDL